MLLRFGFPGPIENFKFFCYNDSSPGNLENDRSQDRFKIYLAGENNVSSSILLKSNKLCRVVSSAMAAETLIQVEATQAFFWLANLLNVTSATKLFFVIK